LFAYNISLLGVKKKMWLFSEFSLDLVSYCKHMGGYTCQPFVTYIGD